MNIDDVMKLWSKLSSDIASRFCTEPGCKHDSSCVLFLTVQSGLVVAYESGRRFEKELCEKTWASVVNQENIASILERALRKG